MTLQSSLDDVAFAFRMTSQLFCYFDDDDISVEISTKSRLRHMCVSGNVLPEEDGETDSGPPYWFPLERGTPPPYWLVIIAPYCPSEVTSILVWPSSLLRAEAGRYMLIMSRRSPW